MPDPIPGAIVRLSPNILLVCTHTVLNNPLLGALTLSRCNFLYWRKAFSLCMTWSVKCISCIKGFLRKQLTLRQEFAACLANYNPRSSIRWEADPLLTLILSSGLKSECAFKFGALGLANTSIPSEPPPGVVRKWSQCSISLLKGHTSHKRFGSPRINMAWV